MSAEYNGPWNIFIGCIVIIFLSFELRVNFIFESLP